MANPNPGPESFKEFSKISWIRFDESIDVSFSAPDAFCIILVELARIIWEVVIEREQFHALGYLNNIILNFSSFADARYFPETRDLRINLGFAFLFSELEKTFAWLSSVILHRGGQISVDDLDALHTPPEVNNEVIRHRMCHTGRLYYTGQRVSVFKEGFASPIYKSILHFILSHEIGHLLYFAAPEGLRAVWRDTVWSDYESAVIHYANTYKLERAALDRLSRGALNQDVASNWCYEFIADAMGFHLAQRVAQREKGKALEVLQIAVEVFYHTLINIGRDSESKTHPSPLLRETMIITRKCKEHGVDWGQFIVEDWGPGTITKTLFSKLIREARMYDSWI